VYAGCDRPLAQAQTTAQDVLGAMGMETTGPVLPATTAQPAPGHGVQAMIDAVRGGWNVDEAFAKGLGWDFPQGALKKTNPLGYAMAKGMMLGLGYGMSGAKFVKAAPALTGGAYCPTPAEANRACDTFRKGNPGVTGLWAQMDKELGGAVGGDLTVEIPSGREIRYFALQRDRRGVSGLTVRSDARRKNLYGALLVENLVQATARDIFAEGLLRLDDAGVDVRLHVHDEAVALCRVEEADEVAATMERCLTTAPDWMPDIPLAAEVVKSEVYCK
jgi:DNA polymerase